MFTQRPLLLCTISFVATGGNSIKDLEVHLYIVSSLLQVRAETVRHQAQIGGTVRPRSGRSEQECIYCAAVCRSKDSAAASYFLRIEQIEYNPPSHQSIIQLQQHHPHLSPK